MLSLRSFLRAGMGLRVLAFILLTEFCVGQLVEPEILTVSPSMLPQGSSNVITISGVDFGEQPFVSVGRRTCSRVVLVKQDTVECTVPLYQRSEGAFKLGVVLTADGLESNEATVTFQPTSSELSVETMVMPGANPAHSEELRLKIAEELDVDEPAQIAVTDLVKQSSEVFKVMFVVMSTAEQPDAHITAEEMLVRHAQTASPAAGFRTWTVRGMSPRATNRFEDMSTGVKSGIIIGSAAIAVVVAVVVGVVISKRGANRPIDPPEKSEPAGNMYAVESFSASDDTVMV